MHEITERHLLARLARAQVDGRLPSMVAGVIADGRLAWSAGRGRVVGRTPDADVQYRIGSITKVFTAVLVLRLRDEGRLRLDDPVERHLPGVALGGRTVGQLLAHTGGLRSELAGPWWERSPGVDWDQLAATLAAGRAAEDPAARNGPTDDRAGHETPTDNRGAAAHDVPTDETLVFPAGRRFHYSNVGYAVLGQVVAQLRGRNWMECLEHEVLAPLEMRRTSAAPQPPAARGYAVHPFADLLLDEQVQQTDAMAPAAELWSTVADLARFGALLLGDCPAVLDPDTVAEMRTPGAVSDTRGGGSSYGLGVQVLAADGRVLIGHGGSMPGFLAGLLVDPAERSGVVVLTNSTTGSDATVATDLLRILREHEPYVPPEWAPAERIDSSVLEMLGPWFWGPACFLLRLTPDGRLEIAPAGAGGGRAARFRHVDGRWVGLDGYYAGETLRPVRAADGSLSHLDIGTFVFTRSPYPTGDVTPGGVPEPGWRTAGPDD